MFKIPYAMRNINISVDIDVFVHDIVRELNEAKTETTNDNYTQNNWCRKRNYNQDVIKHVLCARSCCFMNCCDSYQQMKCKIIRNVFIST